MLQKLLEKCFANVRTTPVAELPVAISWINVARFLADCSPEVIGRVVGEACAAESAAGKPLKTEALQVCDVGRRVF